MVTVRLRYVHGFVDRTGRVRDYFRHRGQRWPLPGQPGSAEFTARYDALLCQCLATDQAANVAFGPGTVGLVIEKYLASADYTSKAVGTQQVYCVALDKLKEICGRALIADLQERHIRQIRQRFPATSKADLAAYASAYALGLRQGSARDDLGRIRRPKFGTCITMAGRMNLGRIG